MPKTTALPQNTPEAMDKKLLSAWSRAITASVPSLYIPKYFADSVKSVSNVAIRACDAFNAVTESIHASLNASSCAPGIW